VLDKLGKEVKVGAEAAWCTLSYRSASLRVGVVREIRNTKFQQANLPEPRQEALCFSSESGRSVWKTQQEMVLLDL